MGLEKIRKHLRTAFPGVLVCGNPYLWQVMAILRLSFSIKKVKGKFKHFLHPHPSNHSTISRSRSRSDFFPIFYPVLLSTETERRQLLKSLALNKPYCIVWVREKRISDTFKNRHQSQRTIYKGRLDDQTNAKLSICRIRTDE